MPRPKLGTKPKVMHSFQKSLDASSKAQTSLKTDNNSDTHYCLSLAERMSGLDNKTKAYVWHSVEKLLFDTESGAYATVVPATQYHVTCPILIVVSSIWCNQVQVFLKTSATI